MSGYILAPEAADDLIEIQDYIARDDYDRAIHTIDECYKAFLRLVQNPYIGHMRKDLEMPEVRVWRVKPYLIIYKPDTNPLAIARVLHERRNISDIYR